MDTHRLPKQLLYGELSSGKQNTGRPQKRYKESVKALLAHVDIPLKSSSLKL